MAAQILIVPRAEQLCNGNRKAVADADDETQNQIVDRAGSADRASALTPQNRPTMMVSASA